jgi:vacuolar-type H+-ATPase subunit F/Vma7
VFIGDELTAAGYRLAGLSVLTPPVEGAAEALERALAESDLILITAEYCQAVPERLLEDPRALVAVVPDARAQRQVADMAARMRRELGIGS